MALTKTEPQKETTIDDSKGGKEYTVLFRFATTDDPEVKGDLQVFVRFPGEECEFLAKDYFADPADMAALTDMLEALRDHAAMLKGYVKS